MMTYMDYFMYYLQEDWGAIPIVALLLFFLGGILFSKKKESSYDKVSYNGDMFRGDSGMFQDDSIRSIRTSSSNFGIELNPATGMTMAGGMDAGGNSYGFSD
jgi:hypothetical protein